MYHYGVCQSLDKIVFTHIIIKTQFVMKVAIKIKRIVYVFTVVLVTLFLSSCRGSAGKKAMKVTSEMIERLSKSAKKGTKLVLNCSDDVARRLDLRQVKCEECGGDGTTWYFTECDNCSGRGYNYEFKFK